MWVFKAQSLCYMWIITRIQQRVILKQLRRNIQILLRTRVGVPLLKKHIWVQRHHIYRQRRHLLLKKHIDGWMMKLFVALTCILVQELIWTHFTLFAHISIPRSVIVAQKQNHRSIRWQNSQFCTPKGNISFSLHFNSKHSAMWSMTV